MIGEGRVVPEGVVPRLITLPITREGVDDAPLVALSKNSRITYLERELLPAHGEADIIGVYLIYVELSCVLSAEEQRLIDAKINIDKAWEKHTEKEGRIPLSGEASARALRLSQWRRETAEALRLPAYTILTNKQLDQIASLNPQTITGLKQIKRFGDKRIRKYGEAILNVIKARADELTTSPRDRSPQYKPKHTVERVTQ